MKVYLFGSTGMLGRYVYCVLKDSCKLQCVTRNDFDILNDNFTKLEKTLQHLSEKDIVINCAGTIPHKVEFQKNNYKEFIKVNTLFPHKLSHLCEKTKSKFIHITTDCVFSGTKGDYSSNDTHDASNIYGVTKSLGEPENSMTIRTSIVGEEVNFKKSLLEWVISNKNNTIQGYTNHFWNGVTCLTLANIIKFIIDNNISWIGVKHIFSPQSVSKFELCTYINKIYNLNISIIPYEHGYKNLTLFDTCNWNLEYRIDHIEKQLQEQKEFSIY